MRTPTWAQTLVAATCILCSTGVPAEASSDRTNPVTIGYSVEGRPIIAERFGTPGGPVVLLVGLIHGNEQGANRLTRSIRNSLLTNGSDADIWLIRNANPDGAQLKQRGNVRGVDLNRNFPTDDWQRTAKGRNYSGTQANSEPETRALATFIRQRRPTLSIWYHQVGPMVDPHPLGDIRFMRRYANVAGYPLRSAPCSGVCAGTATTFHATTVTGATAFVVELPAKVTDEHVTANTDATRQVISMLQDSISRPHR